jgi:hypothetical protein
MAHTPKGQKDPKKKGNVGYFDSKGRKRGDKKTTNPAIPGMRRGQKF